MNYTPIELSDDYVGWRDVHTNTGDFGFLDPNDAPTVCGTTACETRVSLATLGAPSSGTIHLFVRLTNGIGDSFANRQTLPEDDPDNTLMAAELLQVSY